MALHQDEYQLLGPSLVDALLQGRYAKAATGFAGPYVPITNIDLPDWAELLTLGHNWDGGGAEPVSHDAIKNAKKLVASLGAKGTAFEPFAHPSGSVGLEAHESGKSAYLVVSATNRVAYVLRKGETVHRGKDVEASAMQDVLALLY